MASTNCVKILEQCQVAPAFNSPELATEFSLPLTFFDTLWLKFPPVERIFFYELTESSDPTFFNSVILPKLKQSLSHTLLHFLPLAGHLTWPPQSSKPIISCTPSDVVSLTIVESNADFNHLSGKQICEATESHLYVPELPISDDMASVIALQVTIFPNKGFCIGIINHHAILDGKSVTMFIKAWAYMCKHMKKDQVVPPLLPIELTPSFDRTVIKDVDGLEMFYLNHWLGFNKLDSKSNPRSLKVLQSLEAPANSVRATFELSCEDIKSLRKKVLSQLDKVLKPTTYLSTFVLTCAYTLVCMVKAKGGDHRNKNVYFVFSVDSRTRLDPPISENYFGNCVSGQDILTKADLFFEENGVALVAERISCMIKGLENGIFEGAKERLKKFASLEPGTQFIGVAGSTRFGVYGSDFGWGRPKKVEITSIDKTGAISLAESRDGSGGVEIGLVLERHEMEIFASLFVDGLKDH